MTQLPITPTDEQIDQAVDDFKDQFASDHVGAYDSDLERAEALMPADLVD